MKLWISVLIALVLLFLLARWGIKKASPPPDTLYAGGGRLAECPASPNCVSSMDDDPGHAIAAIPGDAKNAFVKLRQAILAAGNARLVVSRDDYLHAEYRSRLLGFIDDLELLLDPAGDTLQIRSASRLGYSDFGVNRKRVASLLKTLDDPA
ncbi:MAG: DUF1499 domain-containing protein [Gammaproteobacteria bacterium]|nr:DUF1499 domain-containing protein [Gammaproteobacteria bacterium]